MGDVGECAEGLKCACVGTCADPMIADYPSTCVEDDEVDCDACVEEFMMNDGCECWMDEECDVEEKVPEGCDSCGDQAAVACDIPMPMTTAPVGKQNYIDVPVLLKTLFRKLFFKLRHFY